MLSRQGTAGVFRPSQVCAVILRLEFAHINLPLLESHGRGPTIAESITLDSAGLPTEWTVKGTTTFGSKVAEHFIRKGARGDWTDSTGKGHSTINAWWSRTAPSISRARCTRSSAFNHLSARRKSQGLVPRNPNKGAHAGTPSAVKD